MIPTEPQLPQWHVNFENLTKTDRLTRLYEDFKAINNLFISLVAKTLKKLILNNVDCNQLKVLINSLVPKRLFKLISKKKTIDQIFLVLSDYWSFFDYDLLASIIKSHCTELKDDLSEYIKDFKAYCDQKVSDAPTKIKSIGGTYHNIIIKVKMSRDLDIELKEIKKLQTQLRKVTKMYLTLLRIEEGSIVLVFAAEDDMIPLSEKDKNELFEMGVLKLYSDNCVYFDHNEYQHLATSDSIDAQPQQTHKNTSNIASVEEEGLINDPQDKTTSGISLKQYSHLGEDNPSSALFRPSHEGKP